MSTPEYAVVRTPLQWAPRMATQWKRTLRGALAGGAAAAVWAAQQPLDMRVFGVPYSDTELLGKWVTRGRAWRAAGLALHVQNGAAFGAVYAQLRRFIPGPPVLLGLGLVMAEHLSSWALIGFVDRLHPRRRELVKLKGNRRAFWQATWRHAFFGLLLAELERRLNSDTPDEPPPVPVASNGRGDIEVAVGAA